jgi:hypothetical protein
VYTFMTLSLPDGATELTCLHLDSSTRLVYVVGGVGVYVAGRVRVDEPLNPLAGTCPLATAESYNVEEDKWEILPPMIQPHGLGCDSVFMEGKFMVFTKDRSAEVFEPSAGTWRRWENMRFRGDLWKKCVASSSGERLFVSCSYLKLFVSCMAAIWRCTEFSE